MSWARCYRVKNRNYNLFVWCFHSNTDLKTLVQATKLLWLTELVCHETNTLSRYPKYMLPCKVISLLFLIYCQEFQIRFSLTRKYSFVQEKMRRKELEVKARLLKRKLEEDYKKGEKRRKKAIKQLKSGATLPSAVVVRFSDSMSPRWHAFRTFVVAATCMRAALPVEVLRNTTFRESAKVYCFANVRKYAFRRRTQCWGFLCATLRRLWLWLLAQPFILT